MAVAVLQGAVIAPLMGLMVYLGTPHEQVDRDVVAEADWGGMLLFGTAQAVMRRLGWSRG